MDVFEAYFDQSSELLLVFGRNGELARLNQAARTMLRISHEPVSGPGPLAAVSSFIRKARDTGETVNAVHKLETARGARVFESVFTPVKDAAGHVSAVMMTSQEARRSVPSNTDSPSEPVVRDGGEGGGDDDLRLLHDLINASGSEEELHRRYLETGMRMFELRGAMISRVHGRTYNVLAAEGAEKGVGSGSLFSLDKAYCSLVARYQHTVASANVADDGRFQDLPSHCSVIAGAYIGAPIWLDGELFGTICFYGVRPRARPFGEQDIEAVEIMASSVGRMMKLRMEQRETDRFFQASPDLMGVLDLEGVLLRFNRRWSQLLGYDPEDLLEMPCLDMVHPNDREEARRAFNRLLESPDTVLSFECRLQGRDGSYHPLEWNAVSAALDNTISVVLRDISVSRRLEAELQVAHADLAEARHQLEKLVATDVLTGLANLRRFDQFYQHEWHRALRYGTPLSLVRIDIDDFSSYNALYGHDRGDEVLRQISLELSHGVFRPGDLVARIGPEEYGMVLADTDEDGSRFVAEKILQQVRALNIRHEQSSTGDSLTVSVGCATVQPHPGVARDSLFEEAGNALQSAKEQGKNCMVGVVNTSVVLPPDPESAAATMGAPPGPHH